MEEPQTAIVDQAAREAVQIAFEESDLGDIEDISGLFLGYANVNFRVKTTAGIYLARFCRAQPLKRIHDEILFLNSIGESGFPAAYPISRKDGNFVTIHQQEKVMLYNYVEGSPPEICADSAHQVGHALGCLSLKTVPAEYSSTAMIVIEDLQRFCEEKASDLKRYPQFRDQFLEQTRFIEAHLPFDLPRGLVHADAFPDNTIFQKGKLVALIDFEDSCVDALIFDVGMAIIGFGYKDDVIHGNLVEALIDGYQSQRMLNYAEREALPEMALWCAHGMAFWHLRHYLKNPNDRQRQRIGELQHIVCGLRGSDGDAIRACF